MIVFLVLVENVQVSRSLFDSIVFAYIPGTDVSRVLARFDASGI